MPIATTTEQRVTFHDNYHNTLVVVLRPLHEGWCVFVEYLPYRKLAQTGLVSRFSDRPVAVTHANELIVAIRRDPGWRREIDLPLFGEPNTDVII